MWQSVAHIVFVIELEKCSINFKSAAVIQSVRRACRADNPVIHGVSYSTAIVLWTFNFCHPGKGTAFVLTDFLFPNSPLRNEAIPNRGVHLNKFYKPYQNRNINNTPCQKKKKIPCKLQGTYRHKTFSQNRAFRWHTSYKCQQPAIIFRDFCSSFFLIRTKVRFGIAFKFVK